MFFTKMLLMPDSSRLKAIVSLSGDQAGYSSMASENVNCESLGSGVAGRLPVTRSSPRVGSFNSVFSDSATYTDSLAPSARQNRSEEHTSELQSRSDLVCRLLL